jgi:hypothetical protein
MTNYAMVEETGDPFNTKVTVTNKVPVRITCGNRLSTDDAIRLFEGLKKIEGFEFIIDTQIHTTT